MRKFHAIAASLLLATMVTGLSWAGSCAEESTLPQRFQIESVLEDIALIHSLDPGLLSAIAQVESRECVAAVSPKGATGLMQLMPATASEFGVEDRGDPVQNALGAARLIDYQRDRPGGKLSLPEILAAYNAGEGAVTRAGGVPHYRETEDYVRRVLWLYLIGHVPDSERARQAALDRRHSTKPGARSTHVASSTRRYAPGSDGAILEQLAQMRRARQQAESSPKPAAQ